MSNKHSSASVVSPAWLVLLTGLFFTGSLTALVSNLEVNKYRADFERRAMMRIDAVRNGMGETVEVLSDVNRLFSTMWPVDHEQFRKFTRPLLERNPQIRSIAFQRLVSEEERPAFEAAMRKRHPGFAVTEFSNGKLGPASRRAQYRVIEYLEPMAGNTAAFGLDASSRREQDVVWQRACATGNASATPLYRLVQEIGTQRGFVILMPTYHRGMLPNDVVSRCRAVLGYTAITLVGSELVEKILAKRKLLGVSGFDIRVYTGTIVNQENLAFHAKDAMASQHALFASAMRIFRPVPGRIEETFEVAGEPWHMVVSDSASPSLKSYFRTLLMLIGGLISSLLAAAYMRALTSRSARVQQIVQERTAALTQANQTLQLQERAIEACVNGIIITSSIGPDYPIEYANPAFEKMTGFSATEVIGRSCSILWGKERNQAGVKEIISGVREMREVKTVLRTYRKDGESFWSEVYIAPVRDNSGEAGHFVVAHYDITEKKRYEKELEYQANHDSLTGLANRNLLRESLHQSIGHAVRYEEAVWVVFLDLDRFKFVNDSFGHHAGDVFLKTISERLRSVVRTSDTVARLGGDEFVLILPEHAGEHLTTAVVHRIMEVITEPIAVEGHELFLSCSAGISVYPTDGRNPEALIENADLAMYRAKELGRNNFQFYTPVLNERAQERLQLETALRGALERSEFLLHYQPQVDLCSGRMVGVEVLLRWQHPELGLVPPGRFIALAEEAGLILPIGIWVLRTACAQIKEWQSAGLGDLRVAINLSVRQFAQPDLVGLVANTLKETGLAAHYLDLEFTESIVMTDVERAVDVLNKLRALGVSLSIDDFGTGYSSLAYLNRFPINVLKIDQSFVQKISPQSNDAAISDAIISMAHSLGIRVIAEGVETEAQCEFLSRNMCDEIQGFVFSKPLAPSDMEALLREAPRLPDRLLRMHKRPRTLLLVDDEPNILGALKRQLRGAGYQILTAPGGKEGLELLSTTEVDVIVSDQRMPGMTGVEFLRAVKTLYPETVRIVLSGFTELQSVTDAVNEGAIYKFLTKPWDDAQLRAHIDEAFQHKEMADDNRRLDLEVRTANYGLAQANRQLEEVLKQQQQQIQHDEITLDIVREALQHVPLPIIGLDDDEIIAFTNVAGQNLFKGVGLILGSEAEQIVPEVLHAIRGVAEGEKCVAEVHGKRFDVVSRSMGRGTQSRGTLITLTPAESA
ncbi:EAL domain-containing protein [Noviherbaspirillum sp. Root189]|uniref:EAL domain-containing protein n=1 Tax=Noviherbaspirillum sp. Root189 TaxID=1736487 RepID=UPI0009E81E1A|nr:EAL domain-containing protein [Noviherbaspirillum sp. Root189]